MTSALLIGSSVGAVIGLIHAWRVYVTRTREIPTRLSKHPISVRARALYFALWTFFLWVLFGTYVLYLWLISIVIYVIYNLSKMFATSIRRG
jgi:hypothetical protein